MSSALSRILAVLCALLAAPVLAQVTDRQARLIGQLPPAERVLAAIPPRAGALDTTVLRMGMLQEFSQLAQSIGPRVLPRELEPAVNQYWKAFAGMQAATLRQTSQQEIARIGETLFRSEKSFYRFRREMFAKILDGELREYALQWHDTRPEVQVATGGLPPAWMDGLPREAREWIERIRMQPPGLWAAVLLAWIVLGIGLRTTPLRLLPDDVWTLQRGRSRRRMEHSTGLVTEVRESVEEVRSVRRPVDQHGAPTGPDQVSVSRHHHMKIFLRSAQGRESSIHLTDRAFDARQGHRLLEVFDARSRRYLFLFNHDMNTYLPMPALGRYVKMRPLILLPLWVLASYAALKLAPAFAPHVFCATPVVYLVFMGFVNRGRRRRFMRTMAPQLVAAASPAPAKGYIGSAESGISPA